MSKHTILLIDDDIEFLRAITKLLSKRNYLVAGAANPVAAMDYVTGSRQHFDLIITDLSMPAMDGIEVLGAIHKLFPTQPVLVVSAFGSAAARADAERLGAFAFLEKPLDAELLVAAIELVSPRRNRPRCAHDQHRVHSAGG